MGGGETNNFMAYFSTMIWGHGGEYISSDFKTVTINQPPAVAGATFWGDLFTKYTIAQDSALQDDGNTIMPLFAQDVVAMYLTGIYNIAPVRKASPNLELGFGVWPKVKGRDPATNLGGWSLIVPKATKNAARHVEVRELHRRAGEHGGPHGHVPRPEVRDEGGAVPES